MKLKSWRILTEELGMSAEVLWEMTRSEVAFLLWATRKLLK